MKRSFSSVSSSPWPLALGGLALVAATYGLVRLAFGLLLPDVQDDLGFDVATAGAISAGASVMYCGSALVAFLCAARRPRSIVVAAALGAAAGSIGMASAHDVLVFATAAILASSGAGLASPALVALLARDRLARSRPQLQGVVNAGTGPGLAVAAMLALVLDDWRSVWIVAAVVAVVAATATLVAHRDDGDGRPTGARVALDRASGRWLAAHAVPLSAALLMGAGSAAVWSFGRSILVDGGATATASITAWIGIGVGGAIAVITASALDTLGPRRAWALTVAAVAGATLLLPVSAGHPWVAIVVCVAFGWGYMAATSALIAWTTSIDDARAPAGTAMLFVVLVLGQALGAAAAGAAVPPVGFTGTFVAAGALSLVAAAAAAIRRGRGSGLRRGAQEPSGTAPRAARRR